MLWYSQFYQPCPRSIRSSFLLKYHPPSLVDQFQYKIISLFFITSHPSSFFNWSFLIICIHSTSRHAPELFPPLSFNIQIVYPWIPQKVYQGYATRAARLVVSTFVDVNLFDLGGAIDCEFPWWYDDGDCIIWRELTSWAYLFILFI